MRREDQKTPLDMTEQFRRTHVRREALDKIW